MNNPPGNYYNAPPPQKSNSGGCLKAAGITCAVLLVLGIIGVVVGGLAVKKAMQNKSGIFGVIGKAMEAGVDGKKIQMAVASYHSKNGHYPNTLTDLVADGEITDAKILHSELDTDPSPGHISWVYTKPSEGAPGNTPLLKLHYRITMPRGSQGEQSTESDIVINLDGTQGSGSAYHSQYGGSSYGGSSYGSDQSRGSSSGGGFGSR